MNFGFQKVQSFWQKLPKKTKVTIIVVFILTLSLASQWLTVKKPSTFIPTPKDSGWQKYQPPGVPAPFFTLKPTTKSEYGVLPSETFVLTTSSTVDTDFIRQNLKSNASIDIKQKSNAEFEIKTKGQIKNEQVISFELPVKGQLASNISFDRNYSWSFQTQPKFSLTSILPGDKKTNVPVNTGIEFVFNQDGYQDPTKFISIDPKIDWRIEKHSNTFSIVPQNPLQNNTIYTVTLRKGLSLEKRFDPLEADTVFTFQTEEYKSNTPRPYLTLSKNLVQISTQEPAAVNAYTSNWTDNTTIQTKIFKFGSSSEFINSRKKIDDSSSYWYRYSDSELLINTSNLSKISDVNLKLESLGNATFLKLPEALPSGYYLVQFWYNDSKQVQQLWLQSTDVSAYTAVGRRQTLVWANDVTTGLPVSQATISLADSSVTHQTSDNGVSVFETPTSLFNKSVHYLTVSSDKGQLLLPIDSLSDQTSSSDKSQDDYWSYIYHERSMYKPGDILNFWGVVKERLNGQTPSNVQITITTGYQSYGSDKNPSQVSLKVSPQNDGSFIGSIPLKNIAKGYYQVNVSIDDFVVKSSGFSITEYEKPELKIEVTSDKTAIFTDEKVEFVAKVSFYDGTPAKNIPLDIYQPTNQQTTQVKTDNNGIIKVTYTPVYKNDDNNYYSLYPRYESITVKSALVNNDNLEGYGSVLVYGEKLSLTPTSRQEGNQAYLSAIVNQVVLENLNQKKSSVTKGNPVPSQEVSLVITKTWWEKVENGTYYDFIEKVTRKTYQYNQHQEKFADTKLKTDQDGKINYQFEMELDKSYKVALSLKDRDGHFVNTNEYFYYYQGSQKNTDDQYSNPRFVLDQKDNKFSLGNKVGLSIKYKDLDYPDNSQNKFLYILSQNGRQDFFVEDFPKFSFEFSPKNIPNVYASAIIFTGKYYQTTTPDSNNDDYYYWQSNNDTYFNSLFIDYNSDDSKLDLLITSDKDKYTPGQTAKVSVNVKKGDQPVAGAQVNLVLVDQAMEAIGGVVKPSILSQLYSTISNQIYYNYYSHKPISYQPPTAEKGGGGGDSRELFKDTPYFGQARTDDNGVANFEFQLPDNITTWLIYSQALSAKLDAGQSESTMISTKDFFVTSNYPSEYLSTDTAFVSANGFGKVVASDQTISYNVKVLKNNQEISNQSGQGKSSSDTQFSLPKNMAGDFKVEVKGTLNNLTDGLVLPFKVIDSRLNVLSNQKIELSKGQSTKSLLLPGLKETETVKLVISDIGYGRYFHQLADFCYNSSNRLEKNLAKYKANKILNDWFDQDYCPMLITDYSKYQNQDGGLSQVVWGGSILETTVWSVFIDPTLFDKSQLVSYFETQLNRSNITSTEKIYSLWGLTLIGKPKISTLYSLSKTALSYQDQVLIGIALANAGDIENSRQIYQDIISNYVYTNKPYYRIETSTNDYIKDTSLALLLGSLVDKSFDPGYYLYLSHFSNQAQDLVLDLGQIAYIESEISTLPQEDSQVVINSLGTKQTINLSKGRSKIVTLSGDKAKSTSISITSGKAEINSLYSLSPNLFSQVKKDDRLSLYRQYTPVDSSNEAIRPGSIVAVRLDFDLTSQAPYDCYTITDHLPSGLTPISNPSLYGLTEHGWTSEVSRNVMQYSFCNNDYWRVNGDKSIVYYARASAIGTYTAEPAILQSKLDLSIIQSTSTSSLTVIGLK